MKIRVVCTQVMSFIVGHGCQPWGLDAGENQPPKGARHQVSFEMADQESGHGSISVRVADEYELAKWVPGMEYDLLIEGTSLVAAEEVESSADTPPEGFVIQDKVAARPGIDVFRWSHWPNKNHWAAAAVDNVYLHEGHLHGYHVTDCAHTLIICCRPNEYPTDSSAETVKPVINPYEAHCRRMDDIQRAEGVSYEEKLVSVRHSTSMLFDTIEARATEPVCGAAELNDDGIVGMYTDPPQPIESAGGGVQQCEPLKAYPQAPVPSDLNVDADE